MITHTRALIAFAGLLLAATSAFGQRVEETSTAFTYNGAWTPVTDPNASGGAYTMSSSAGSTVTFSIAGNNFVLYRKVDQNGGIATITVDGKNFGQIPFYFQETRWQVPAAVDNLGTGNHTIVLTVSATQPAGSGGTNVYLDAMDVPVPAMLGPTPDQLSAVSRTNFYRNLMQLPVVRHNIGLGLAAQAHAKYLSDLNFISNNVDPHMEMYGASPDFTGVNPGDRDALFGFTGGGLGSEDSNNNPDPIVFVDGWMDGVYHRTPYLAYSFTEVGFGGYPVGSAMDFGQGVVKPLSPTGLNISTYPSDGQTDVWINYDGGDGPNNLPQGPDGAYGYPISLSVAEPAGANTGTATMTATTGTTGTLTDAAGNNIPVTVADSSMDRMVGGAFFMVPNQPLSPSTTYTAHMTGTDTLMNSFDKTWKFTTCNVNAVHRVSVTAGTKTYMYFFNWRMVGSTVPSQVQYGPTTAYGNVIAGSLVPGSQSAFQALAPGLVTMAGLIHYQVTATDANGNVYTSPDHTLTVTNAIAPATIGFVQVYPGNQDTSFQYETAGLVASTQVNYGATAAYGLTTMSNLFVGATTMYSADLFNLPSGSTYHYQIVATDMQGNTFSTPDATFVVP